MDCFLKHQSVLNAPSCPDDFSDGGVQVQLGDKAVHDAEEELGTLLGLLLELAHCVHVSDGIHCRHKVDTNNHIHCPLLQTETFNLSWKLYHRLSLKTRLQSHLYFYINARVSF